MYQGWAVWSCAEIYRGRSNNVEVLIESYVHAERLACTLVAGLTCSSYPALENSIWQTLFEVIVGLDSTVFLVPELGKERFMFTSGVGELTYSCHCLLSGALQQLLWCYIHLGHPV